MHRDGEVTEIQTGIPGRTAARQYGTCDDQLGDKPTVTINNRTDGDMEKIYASIKSSGEVELRDYITALCKLMDKYLKAKCEGEFKVKHLVIYRQGRRNNNTLPLCENRDWSTYKGCSNCDSNDK